jgi:hypothetical protein
MAKKRFWNFPKYSKLDILYEGEFNHDSVILTALADKETLIERVDRDSYTIYGAEESLLIKPVSPVLKISLFIYCSILSLIHS